jgi:hypothetical protein
MMRGCVLRGFAYGGMLHKSCDEEWHMEMA